MEDDDSRQSAQEGMSHNAAASSEPQAQGKQTSKVVLLVKFTCYLFMHDFELI